MDRTHNHLTSLPHFLAGHLKKTLETSRVKKILREVEKSTTSILFYVRTLLRTTTTTNIILLSLSLCWKRKCHYAAVG